MNAQELLQTSMEIMIRYYNNDIEMALEHFHTDIFWMGPMQGQMIRSREQLVNAFRRDVNTMTFHLFDMRGQIVHNSPKQCDILLTYFVDSFYPDKSVIRVDQRIFFSWIPEKLLLPDGSQEVLPRIRTCLIGNSMPTDEHDSIYPNHFVDTSLAKYYVLDTEPKHFDARGKHGESLYFDQHEVVYLESRRPGCIVHTTTASYECAEPLAELQKRAPDAFVRVHSSYLVNPLYVRAVQRFRLTLQNGCTLPIPEKKYTQVKAQIAQRLQAKQPDRP